MTPRKALTIDDVGEMLHLECERSGGQLAWAKEHGVSPQYVNDVISWRKRPGKMIADALGLVENPRTWSLTKYDNKRTKR